MSVAIVFNGLSYTIPQTGDESWGEQLTSYFVAIPQGALQKTGGTFTLTAEANFGATYGLLSAYFKTRASNPSTAGLVRLAVGDSIGWRNNANGGNLLLAVNASDQLTFNGTAIYPAGITALTGDVTATGPGSVAATIANNAVTLAKMAQIATASFLGRNTASTGDVEVLSATVATALLNAMVGDSGAGGTKGLVPAPATGDAAAGKFLKADGTWVAPTGSVTSVAMSVPAASILAVSGSPITSAGTLDLTTTGTSGGIPYFSSTSALSSSALLTASQVVIGGGAGAAPATLAAGTNTHVLTMVAGVPAWSAPAAAGVSSVALSVPATSIFGVTGSPITSAGTIDLTTTGTSGGIPYFSSTSQLATSALLAQYGVVLGGGAGGAPATLAPNASTAFPLVSGGASANPSWAALTVAGGGTGITSGTQGGLVYFSSTSAMASTAALTQFQLLRAGGTGAPTVLSAGTAGEAVIIDANGTAPQYIRLRPMGNTNYLDRYTIPYSTSTGWSLYGDAAQNTPVNGTAGTTTGLTYSRSTTTPMNGDAQFSLVVDAANRQGKGISTDFTIDRADQAKVFSIGFNFNASSTFTCGDGITAPLNDGTTSTNAGNSDLEVFIYDVTNSTATGTTVLIPVTPQVITAKGDGYFRFQGSFQTASNSLSYRLIFHIATANTAGWTFLWDNVVVGPQALSYGFSGTDEAPYTPTFTGCGTMANNSIFWQKLGDKLRIFGTVNAGTTTGSTWSMTLPSGMSIDTNKISTNASGAKVGQLWVATGGTQFSQGTGTGASNGPYALFFDGSTLGTIYVCRTPSGVNMAKDVGTTFGTGATFHIDLEVPIAGWSSNVLMSNDANTRLCSATVDGTAATITASNPLIFPTVVQDTHGAYNATTGRYTVPVSGTYRVSFFVAATASNATIWNIYKNASIGDGIGFSYGDRSAGSGKVTCVAGDIIDVRPAANITSTGTGQFTVEQIQGPAAIAASEKVFLQYTGNAGGAITGLTTNIDFANKVYDSSGAWNGTTFTAPRASVYRVSGSVSYTTAGTQNVYLYKSGVQFLNLANPANAAQKLIIGELYLLAGESFTIRSDAGTLTNSSGSVLHWISISSQG